MNAPARTRTAAGAPEAPAISSAHIATSLGNPAAGTSYSVPRLVEALGAAGHPARSMSIGAPVSGARDGRFPPSRGPLSGALGQSAALREATARSAAEILHVHGLWRDANLYAMAPDVNRGRPVILSPRGMLGREALEYSRWRKALYTWLRQGRALARVAVFHATADSEVEDIRAFGLTAPVAVVPNGIDVPETDPAPSERYLLSLGRIHPKKGLPLLIEAWAGIAPAHPGWRLRIAGPDEGGHAGDLQRQVRDLGLTSVDITGAVYGADKDRLMSRAHAFVLPTRHENFAMTVAESLARGVPAIVTKGAPWSGLVTERAGWWVDRDAGALATAMTAAMALTEAERAGMGGRGRSWMERDFAWPSVAERMSRVYSWMLARGPRPEFVQDGGAR